MEIIIKETRKQASEIAANIVADLVKRKKPAVLGFATGATPLALYQELIRRHGQGALSFKDTVTFNLDEYVALDPSHPSSYHRFMEDNLFQHVDVPQAAIHLPDGRAENIPAACEAYEKAIKDAGGIDLQILGIGGDGHLAFNEPGSSLSSRTRIKTLTKETRTANSRYFGDIDQVPKHVITMGLGTIMEAKACLVLAFGAGKAEAVRDMIEGPVSSSCPASILQFHAHAIALMDQEAAARLRRLDYYLEVYHGKPAWQRWE